jgi:hypothetical protein
MRYILAIVLVTFISIYATTLEEVILASPPKNGYDHWVELDGKKTYTGGIYLSNLKVRLIGHGALVTMIDTDCVFVTNGEFSVDHVIFVGGQPFSIYYALGTIVNNTFYNTMPDPLYFYEALENTVVKNNIIVQTARYGIAVSYRTIMADPLISYNDIYKTTDWRYAKNVGG